MVIKPGLQFEPPYVGSYNQGVHGEGSSTDPSRGADDGRNSARIGGIFPASEFITCLIFSNLQKKFLKRVRGKGTNEYEGFPLSNSGLTDAPCPAFTHWKRRGTKNWELVVGIWRA